MRRASLLPLLLLSACNLAPHYRVPVAAKIPPNFREVPGWRIAAPSDAIAKGKWWELLGDPVLNGLEERVATANQTVAQALATYDQARATVREERAALFPTIDLSTTANAAGSFGSRTVTITGGTTTSGSGTTTTGGSTTGGSTGVTTVSSGGSRRYTVSIGATWEPDLFGRIRNTVAQARGQAQASAADLANAILAAQGELATDYLQLRAIEAQQAILNDSVQAYARALTITNNRYTQGVVAKVDVLQAETQLRNARGDAQDLARQHGLLDHAIAVLVGESASTFAVPAATWVRAVPDVPSVLPSELLERRPDVAAAERRVAAANAAIGIQKAAFFPDFQLSGDTGFNGSKLGSLFTAASSVWSLGLNGALTLLDFGARSARVAEARAAYEAAVANYRQTALTAFQQVEDGLVATRILASVAAERSAAAAAASRVEQLTRNQYLSGQIVYTDVVTAQATALTARRAEAQAISDRQTAVVSLIQAIGGRWDGADPTAAPPATR